MEAIKLFLKRFDWIRAINARWKASRVEARYRRTEAHFAERSRITPHDALLARRLEAWNRPARREPLRVFYFGTDEQQDRSGFLQALSRLSEVTVFTRADGAYGQNDPAPITLRRRYNSKRLLEIFAQLESERRVPHILLSQTWASAIDPDAFRFVRDRYGSLVVNISMDDRHQFWGERWRGTWTGTYPLVSAIDLALTTASECTAWYEKEGCPALYFPLASDPDLFHPMPALPKLHDVCFVGGRYGIRSELVTALQESGVKVAAYGSGWMGGRIAVDEVPRLFAQSRIVLGIGTIGYCQDFFALKLRDFDGPMSGTTYLTNDNPDLHGLFDIGKEIVVYRDSAECVKEARRLLGDRELRESVGREGRARCLREHTWDIRLREVFGILCPGLLT